MNSIISIIIPVYNAEKYLKDAIESVINQTYKNIEIVLIDDGSTDDSANICKNYLKDARVKYYHQENKGLSASRQFGIDHCNGSYFATIDADDFIATDYIEKMYLAITKNNCDICICEWSDFYDERTELYIRPLHVSYDYVKVTTAMLSKKFKQFGDELSLSDSWNKLYRTDFVRQTGVKFELEKKYNGNDLAFNYKLLLHCPSYCVIKESLLFHRIVNGSMVHKKKQYLQEGFNCITDQIISEMDQLHYNFTSQLSLFYYNLLSLVFWEKLEYAKDLKIFIVELKEMLYNHNQYISMRKIGKIKNYSSLSIMSKYIVWSLQNNSIFAIFLFALNVSLKRKILGRKK